MTMQIITCAQRSEDWYRARIGIPTASEFATVMTTGRGGAESKTRLTYMYKLAGEILTGEPMESYSNHHMERGAAMEPEVRELYRFINDAELHQVGFIRNGDKGCSPDSLIGEDGMLEIKTSLPHLVIPHLHRNEFALEHKAQCQGQLWIAEREWVDLAIYWPKLPLFVVRAYRDEPYIKELARAVDQFNDELAEVVEAIRNYDGVPNTVPYVPIEEVIPETAPVAPAAPAAVEVVATETPAAAKRPTRKRVEKPAEKPDAVADEKPTVLALRLVPDVVDEQAWLASIARSFDSCTDVAAVQSLHADRVRPQRDKVSKTTFAAAERLAREAIGRRAADLLMTG